MKTRTLSSARTFFTKFMFPGFWIAGFGAGVAWMWLGGVAKGKYTFLGAWIVGAAVIIRQCAGLKRVRLGNGVLYVSNYLKEIEVPVGNIDNVTENTWLNFHPVTIHFSEATEFGDSVVFMPKFRVAGPWSGHPVVEELLNAAGMGNGSGHI